MIETKHTPGPWTYRVTRQMISIESKHPTNKQIANDDISIAGIWGLGKSDKANAKIIAAAPDLLEALQRVILTSNYEDAKKRNGNDENHWTNIVEKAIKKATV